MNPDRAKISNIGNKVGNKGLDWNKIDRETLPLVKQAAEKIYHNDGKRPHRVNVHSVKKELKLENGRLEKMPECMKVIQEYSETQQHYWAREVVWAVHKILESGEDLNWYRISMYTNIKRKALISCLPELKDMDLNVWEQVRGIL